MILAYILLGISFLVSLIRALMFNREKYWWMHNETGFTIFMSWFTISLFTSIVLYSIAQFIGWGYYTKTQISTYNVNIVSIQDGSQVNGDITTGYFTTRIMIGEIEYFTYYKDNGNGTFALDKKEADRSVIIQDTTPETAYVKITDKITSYKPTKESEWWLLPVSKPDTGIYLHGEFHVPTDSIKNNFILDAK